MQQLAIDDLSLNNTLPAVATATIMGSQCSSLISLSIMAPVVGLEGEGIAALVALTRLTQLEVRSVLLAHGLSSVALPLGCSLQGVSMHSTTMAYGPTL